MKKIIGLLFVALSFTAFAAGVDPVAVIKAGPRREKEVTQFF